MSLKGKHIFIVEDNLQNRVIFQMVLMRNGATVDFERQGQHALFYLQKALQVDLIILDLMLAHGVSGFELFDEIRLLPAFAHTPIVAVSAMDVTIAIPQVQQKGFQGFIAKPIDARLFPQQIETILSGESIWYYGR